MIWSLKLLDGIYALEAAVGVEVQITKVDSPERQNKYKHFVQSPWKQSYSNGIFALFFTNVQHKKGLSSLQRWSLFQCALRFEFVYIFASLWRKNQGEKNTQMMTKLSSKTDSYVESSMTFIARLVIEETCVLWWFYVCWGMFCYFLFHHDRRVNYENLIGVEAVVFRRCWKKLLLQVCFWWNFAIFPSS